MRPTNERPEVIVKTESGPGERRSWARRRGASIQAFSAWCVRLIARLSMILRGKIPTVPQAVDTWIPPIPHDLPNII